TGPICTHVGIGVEAPARHETHGVFERRVAHARFEPGLRVDRRPELLVADAMPDDGAPAAEAPAVRRPAPPGLVRRKAHDEPAIAAFDRRGKRADGRRGHEILRRAAHDFTKASATRGFDAQWACTYDATTLSTTNPSAAASPLRRRRTVYGVRTG